MHQFRFSPSLPLLLCLAIPAFGFVACGESQEDADADTGDVAFPEAESADAAATYAKIVSASYEDSLALAEELATATAALVDAPTTANLTVAREAWLASREPYLQTEVYRFYGGPIDNEDDGPEGLMNAWPLDEAYIDYVDGKADSGIVNDPTVEISAENLASLNEQGGESNIATGYHAIEFLLWGQDMSVTGPGERPATDYETADNADRRGEYLNEVSGLLVSNLQGLTDSWATGDADNYRAEWAGLSGEEAMRRMLTGMIILSGFETGGERLQTALDSGDQEDEHSCFSDNTHRDMIQDIQGVLNVWKGSYTRDDGTVVSGPGIEEAVELVDAQLAEDLDAQIKESLSLANALETPFDQEIASSNTEGQERVSSLVQALRAQENLLEEVFRAFGLAVPVAE